MKGDEAGKKPEKFDDCGKMIRGHRLGSDHEFNHGDWLKQKDAEKYEFVEQRRTNVGGKT